MAVSNHRPAGNPLRRITFDLLESGSRQQPLAGAVNVFLIALILLNVVAVVMQTVEPVERQLHELFRTLEVFSVTVFSAEYLARLWVCTQKSQFGHGHWGRLRYALTPMALIDLLAILPFFISGLAIDLRFLRVMRLLRLARILKLGRYSNALQLISRILVSKKEELAVALAAVLSLLLVASSFMYFIENRAQPDAFASIPDTMWWAVATLTTVGYGDVFPITPFGKLFGSLIAIFCLGLFALPAGIIAGGFSEELQRSRSTVHACPHCGKDLGSVGVEPGSP
jgi:voltage-gated potassium channel